MLKICLMRFKRPCKSNTAHLLTKVKGLMKTPRLSVSGHLEPYRHYFLNALERRWDLCWSCVLSDALIWKQEGNRQTSFASLRACATLSPPATWTRRKALSCCGSDLVAPMALAACAWVLPGCVCRGCFARTERGEVVMRLQHRLSGDQGQPD